MIPLIYPGSATDFTTLGIGSVPEALSCLVDEVRNQSNTLALTAPLDAIHRSELVEGNLIIADTNERLKRQPYEIVHTEENLSSGRIIVNAQHAAYRLRYSVTKPFTAAGASAAMTWLNDHSLAHYIEPNAFTFETDLTGSASATYGYVTVWDLLHGTEGSLIDTFGGVLEMDGFTVRLLQRRGQDNGVIVRYGKNLKELERTIDSGDVFDGVFPIFTSGGVVQRVGTRIAESEYRSRYSYQRTRVVDFSGQFQTTPTAAQLDAAADAMVAGQGLPEATITGEFVPLSATLEYADLALLEPVAMDDTIRFVVPSMGIDISTRVVATHWDVLRDRYQSVEVGDVRQTIRQAIAAI